MHAAGNQLFANMRLVGCFPSWLHPGASKAPRACCGPVGISGARAAPRRAPECHDPGRLQWPIGSAKVYVRSFDAARHQRLDDHGDEPASIESESKKVVFEPFVGVGPRRYFDLFSMKLSDGYPLKRKVEGKTAPWSKGPTSVVRVPMPPTSYLQREAKLAQTAVLEEKELP
jgi:hypothetical protein